MRLIRKDRAMARIIEEANANNVSETEVAVQWILRLQDTLFMHARLTDIDVTHNDYDFHGVAMERFCEKDLGPDVPEESEDCNG